MTENAVSTDQNRSGSETSTEGAGTRPPRTRRILRWFWPVLYVVTVAGLIWRYEFRPAQSGLEGLQGVWREVTGAPPDERPADSYLHVDENETWFVYERPEDWGVHRSRISIRPADNCFVVRRSFGSDFGGDTRETEYVVYLKDGAFYHLAGLADLDPVNEPEVRKFWRADALPDPAKDAIRAYTDRVSSRTP